MRFILFCRGYRMVGDEGRESRKSTAADGKIKRTGVRWLPLVAKVCLHIGFCTLRSHLDETSQGEQLAAKEFPNSISIS
jgi:hypothetical protein